MEKPPQNPQESPIHNDIPEKYRKLLEQYEADYGPQSEKQKRDTLKTWKDADRKKDEDADIQTEIDRKDNDQRADLVAEFKENMDDRGSNAGSTDLEDMNEAHIAETKGEND